MVASQTIQECPRCFARVGGGLSIDLRQLRIQRAVAGRVTGGVSLALKHWPRPARSGRALENTALAATADPAAQDPNLYAKNIFDNSPTSWLLELRLQ